MRAVEIRPVGFAPLRTDYASAKSPLERERLIRATRPARPRARSTIPVVTSPVLRCCTAILGTRCSSIRPLWVTHRASWIAQTRWCNRRTGQTQQLACGRHRPHEQRSEPRRYCKKATVFLITERLDLNASVFVYDRWCEPHTYATGKRIVDDDRDNYDVDRAPSARQTRRSCRAFLTSRRPLRIRARERPRSSIRRKPGSLRVGKLYLPRCGRTRRRPRGDAQIPGTV